MNLDSGDDCVIIEGRGEATTDEARRRAFVDAYSPKYGWSMTLEFVVENPGLLTPVDIALEGVPAPMTWKVLGVAEGPDRHVISVQVRVPTSAGEANRRGVREIMPSRSSTPPPYLSMNPGRGTPACAGSP